MNPDCMTLDELTAIVEDTRIHPYLRDYASHKASAMSARLAGRIASALVYEGVCEGIYRKLPNDLKW